MGHRRIGDQLLDVGLTKGDQRGVDHCDHRQGEDQRREIVAGAGKHGDREAQEAVSAHLQQNARQDHRSGRRRLHVGVGQPGMHGPHGHLDRERGEEGQPEPDLQLGIEMIVQELGDRGGVGDADHGQDGRQHQHRSQQGVEEELEGRIDPVLAAPDADDQEHRDQLAFEEDVEDHDIEGAEHPYDQSLQDQEGDHIFQDPGLDRLPAGHDTERQQKGGQQHEQHRNAVDAHAVTPAAEPIDILYELEAALVRIELDHQQDRQGEGRQGRGERDPPGGVVGARQILLIAEQAQDQDRGDADEGREDGGAEDRHAEDAGHDLILLTKTRRRARSPAGPQPPPASRRRSDRHIRSATGQCACRSSTTRRPRHRGQSRR